MLLLIFILFLTVEANKVNNFVESNSILTNSVDNINNFGVSIESKKVHGLLSNFEILGSAIDFAPINVEKQECEYSTTCPSIICEILSNKTLSNMGLAYVILYPIESLKCTTITSISNAIIITFIISYEEKFITPIACNNVGECFSKTCLLFNAKKDNIGLGFTGQCQ